MEFRKSTKSFKGALKSIKWDLKGTLKNIKEN